MRLIDAESLFRFLNDQRVKETGAFSKGLNKGINIARGAVRNEEICPTVDAVPVVHGRWLETQEPLSWNDVDCIECSNCHESWIIDEDCDFDDLADCWKYCSNCGAKMNGGNEDATTAVQCKACVYRHDSCFAGDGNIYCDLKHTYSPLDGSCKDGVMRDGGKQNANV